MWSLSSLIHCVSLSLGVKRENTHRGTHVNGLSFQAQGTSHTIPNTAMKFILSSHKFKGASSPVRSHLSPNCHVCSLKIEQPKLLTAPEYVQSTFSAMERSDEFGLVMWTEFVSSSVNISQLHYSCCLVQRLWSAYSLVSYYKSSTDWSHRLLEFLALQVLKRTT